MDKIPRVFIAGASYHEALVVATHALLSSGNPKKVEPIAWNTAGILKHGLSLYPNLSMIPNKFDFGVFILGPKPENISISSERDKSPENVIFEAGIFVGQLGIRHVFLLTAKGTAWVNPTDFDGAATFNWDPGEDKGLFEFSKDKAQLVLMDPVSTIKDIIVEVFEMDTMEPNYHTSSQAGQTRWQDSTSTSESTNRESEAFWEMAAKAGKLKKALESDAIPDNLLIHAEFGVGKVVSIISTKNSSFVEISFGGPHYSRVPLSSLFRRVFVE